MVEVIITNDKQAVVFRLTHSRAVLENRKFDLLDQVANIDMELENIKEQIRMLQG